MNLIFIYIINKKEIIFFSSFKLNYNIRTILKCKELSMSIINTEKEKNGSLKKNFVDAVSFYKNDPFVGHLSTPITNSKIVRTYLNLLPLYNNELSFFLKGLVIGIFHGYFLFGPFALLGPLRNTEPMYFIGFLASLSLLIIINLFAVLYGHVTFKNNAFQKTLFLTSKEWNKFISGFSLGGFGGVSLAYILTKFF